MAEAHFVSGLKQRRAEYLGNLQQLQDEIAKLEAKEREVLDLLGHLDALLKFEAPEVRLDQIKPRKPRDSSRATTDKGRQGIPLTKAVLRVLRTEDSAMSVDEVVDRLSPDYPDIERQKLVRNVRLFLSARKKSGALVGNGSRPLRYSIAPLAMAA